MIKAGSAQIVIDHHLNSCRAVCGDKVGCHPYGKSKDIKPHEIWEPGQYAVCNVIVKRILLKKREHDVDGTADNAEKHHHRKPFPVRLQKREQTVQPEIRQTHILLFFLLSGFVCLTVHAVTSSPMFSAS